MNKISNKNDIMLIEETAHSIGIELSTITSLVNFLELVASDNIDISNVDVENLVSLLKEKIAQINKDYSSLEALLGV